MDMSETWPPAHGSDDPPETATAAGDETAPTTPPAGPSIPLGPAGQAAPPAPVNPHWVERPYAAPGQEMTAPTPPAGTQPGATPYPQPPYAAGPYATHPGPSAYPGAPTPPAGTWPASPGQAWGAPPAAGGPFGGGWPGGAGGTTPPYGGWPAPGPAPQPKGPARKGVVMTVATLMVVVAVLAGVAIGHAVWTPKVTTTAAASPNGGSGSSGSNPFGGSGSSESPLGGSGSSGSGSSSSGAGAPSDISAIAAKVDPGLVDINTNLSYQSEQAAGTGQVLTSNGVILTNNHVIDGATSISVTDIGNGKTYKANVVGYDRTQDVAVIKLVDASGLQTVTPASGSASVGEAIVGIGNAGGTGGTPSTAGGSVTALNQSITASDDGGGNAENLTGLIEINAAIEPGDSGGSLVNAQGEVLGMDTAASEDSGFQNSGTQAYAIPIATALNLAKKIQNGDASSTIHIGATGFLGVSVENAGSSSSSNPGSLGGAFGGGLGDGSGSGTGSGNTATSGAQVVTVLSGSAAGQAGVAEGDVITSLNGSNVSTATALSGLLEPLHPGNTVQLQWTDASGTSHTASVTLATGPPA
jgi:S1-C subfamily serine protease